MDRSLSACSPRGTAELELPHELRLESGHVGRVTVPDSTPDEIWAAMGRVRTDWPEPFLGA